MSCKNTGLIRCFFSTVKVKLSYSSVQNLSLLGTYTYTYTYTYHKIKIRINCITIVIVLLFIANTTFNKSIYNH